MFFTFWKKLFKNYSKYLLISPSPSVFLGSSTFLFSSLGEACWSSILSVSPAVSPPSVSPLSPLSLADSWPLAGVAAPWVEAVSEAESPAPGGNMEYGLYHWKGHWFIFGMTYNGFPSDMWNVLDSCHIFLYWENKLSFQWCGMLISFYLFLVLQW